MDANSSLHSTFTVGLNQQDWLCNAYLKFWIVPCAVLLYAAQGAIGVSPGKYTPYEYMGSSAFKCPLYSDL
jgi:hypothetical protein